MQFEHRMRFVKFCNELYYAEALECWKYSHFKQHCNRVMATQLHCHPSVCPFLNNWCFFFVFLKSIKEIFWNWRFYCFLFTIFSNISACQSICEAKTRFLFKYKLFILLFTVIDESAEIASSSNSKKSRNRPKLPSTVTKLPHQMFVVLSRRSFDSRSQTSSPPFPFSCPFFTTTLKNKIVTSFEQFLAKTLLHWFTQPAPRRPWKFIDLST